jgi:hypothetical protein
MPKRLSQHYNMEQFDLLRAIMKKRYLYALLSIIPTFLISLPLSINIFADLLDAYNALGRLPRAYSEEELFNFLIVIFFVTWIVLIIVAFLIGWRLESGPPLRWGPTLILVFTLLFFAYLLRWGANYANEKVNIQLCAEYCQSHGYRTSIPSPFDAPEQTCYCSKSSGESVTVPLEDLR